MRLARTALVARMFARMVGRVPARHLWYLFRRMRFEKPHRFGGQVRINTFFPPYPSPAFDRFCDAVIARRRVPYSTYLAVTGRCPYDCGHCSYAGRPCSEMSRDELLRVIGEIKSIGTCTLGLTGGEPLLRDDLPDLVAAAGPEMACILFTTGHRLDAARARQLADAGVACVTIGLESADAAEHDRVRGRAGSFVEAEAAAGACRNAGIYLAVSTIGTREKLASGELERLYQLAARWGAGEFRILTPIATGAWKGCGAAMLSPDEHRALGRFHEEHNRLADGPAIAGFAYLESDEVFGCGAGFHHLFIDAAGNVCPCDLTPLSFGDVKSESLLEIWNRMSAFFPAPRRGCLMQEIAGRITEARAALPLERAVSERICAACQPQGPLPEGYRRLMRSGQRFTNPGS
jgi:MoaA/NifB/PqqE/SkfB family radical SAM enzyme